MMMKILELLGILTASLLGSWHCASMCGPIAVFCQGSEKSSYRGLVLYHSGRLASYLTLFFIFEGLGVSLNLLVEKYRLQMSLVGGLYVISALWFFAMFFNFKPALPMPRAVFKINQFVLSKWRGLAPLFLGLSTGALPCFWLYGFIVLALAQSSTLLSLGVIVSFWIGTIPALSLSHALFSRWKHVKWVRRLVPLLIFVATAIAISRIPLPANSSAPTCPHHTESS